MLHRAVGACAGMLLCLASPEKAAGQIWHNAKPLKKAGSSTLKPALVRPSARLSRSKSTDAKTKRRRLGEACVHCPTALPHLSCRVVDFKAAKAEISPGISQRERIEARPQYRELTHATGDAICYSVLVKPAACGYEQAHWHAQRTRVSQSVRYTHHS